MVLDQQSELRGEMRYNEPMSRYTSWRVGGLAKSLYRPADLEDLGVFLGSLPQGESLLWLGLGSNLLVRDGGISGTVIVTQGMLNEIGVVVKDANDAVVIRAEAGVPCAKVARFCSRSSTVGAEFLAGIPGTMGGALAMNAGAFGSETWDHVVAVETIDRVGKIRTKEPREFEVGYRSVKGSDNEWFVAAHLLLRKELKKGDATSGQARIKELLEQRNKKQPIGLPSCGSVFRNPENDYAARLIEAAGLKGECIGKACVSDKHANFIINTGNATAGDIEALINRIMQVVEQKQDVRLKTEVQIVGEEIIDGDQKTL